MQQYILFLSIIKFGFLYLFIQICKNNIKFFLSFFHLRKYQRILVLLSNNR